MPNFIDTYLGAHTSGQNGLHNALLEGVAIGATTIQLFTANQRRWEHPSLLPQQVDLWHATLESSGIKKVMSHASYLINLGSPREEIFNKSGLALKEEIKRCRLLDIDFLNFHPGAALDSTEADCLNRIVSQLESLDNLLELAPLHLLIETTAGQGSSVGHRLEQIAFLIKQLAPKLPIGVCIDTCHLFAAGYDIGEQEGWNKFLKEFDQTVGLSYLYAIHLNDSSTPLGSRIDRHAPLGKGHIGWESFERMMQHPSLNSIPKYLETPGGPENWKKEIAILKQLAQKKR